MLHRETRRTSCSQELSGEIPGERVHGATGLENLGSSGVALLSQIENGHRSLALGSTCEPVAVLGEGECLDRGAKLENCGLLEGLGHEELDVSGNSAGGEQMTVRVEGAGRES